MAELDENKIKKILLDISNDVISINEEDEEEAKKTGKYFNIFDILNVSHKEVMICKFLRELIDPCGNHYQGDIFLNLFYHDVLKITIEKDEDLSKARISRELVIKDNRRIDITIETNKRKIAIEVKIYAKDQDKQCEDYLKWTDSLCKKGKLYYLTIDGHNPSEDSYSIDDDAVECVSFNNNIMGWLINCEKIAKERKMNEQVINNIKQFQFAIRRFCNMDSERVNDFIKKELLKDDNLFKCAISINNVFEEIKRLRLKEFFDDLKNRLGREWKYNDEDAFDVYYSKKNLPELNRIIKSKSYGDVTIGIIVDYNLYFYFDICNKKYNTDDNIKKLIRELKFKEGELNAWEYLPNSDSRVNFKEMIQDYYLVLNDKESLLNDSIKKIKEYESIISKC